MSVVSVNLPFAGLENNLRMVSGQVTTEAAVDAVATGLSTVLYVVAVLASSPVAGCQTVTAKASATTGAIDISTWKATAAGDTALIAATTFSKLVNFIAVGY